MKKRTIVEAEKQEKIVGIFASLNPEQIQELFERRAERAVLALGVELLEQDVERLCGARYARKAEQGCYRFGTEGTSIVVGGARYGVERPRIRSADGEVYPPMLGKLRSQDLLDDEMKERLLLGVSTRNYERVIEGYSDKIGVSKSSVSRAFRRASQEDLDAINHGDLSKYSFIGLLIDGIEFAGRVVVAAVAISAELEKVPVGLIEGDTENATVVKDLLASLIERGFQLHCAKLLCILDGSKALRKAVLATFGSSALIQRCWLHKYRNIKAYLPKAQHKTLWWRMKKLMGLESWKAAQRELASLRKWLLGISYDAATSLDEAGEELLTLHRLGIGGELRKSLSTTNIIESLFSVVRRKLANVKNWKSRQSAQTLRWAATAIAQHKKDGMRRLRGLNQGAKLIQALGQKLDEQKMSA